MQRATALQQQAANISLSEEDAVAGNISKHKKLN